MNSYHTTIHLYVYLIIIFLLFAENEYEVKTKIIVADFSKGQPIYEHIEKELQNIPIGLLGNTVSFVILNFCRQILFYVSHLQ